MRMRHEAEAEAEARIIDIGVDWKANNSAVKYAFSDELQKKVQDWFALKAVCEPASQDNSHTVHRSH